MERMTTASASTVGRRSPARSWTLRSQMTHSGAGGWREEGCPLLSHLNLGILNTNAEPTGLCRTLSVAVPQGFSFLSLGASGCRRAVPPALPPERGEKSWPKHLSLQLKAAGHSDCDLLFTLRLELSSCISEARVCNKRCCAHPPSVSGGLKGGGFLHGKKKKFFPLKPLCCQGLLSYLHKNCPSCTPFSSGNVLYQKQ